jgi:hypothetical protein
MMGNRLKGSLKKLPDFFKEPSNNLTLLFALSHLKTANSS